MSASYIHIQYIYCVIWQGLNTPHRGETPPVVADTAGAAVAGSAGSVGSAAAAVVDSAAGEWTAAVAATGSEPARRTRQSPSRMSQQVETPPRKDRCWSAPRHQRRRGSSGPGRRMCEATPLLRSGAISDLEKRQQLLLVLDRLSHLDDTIFIM